VEVAEVVRVTVVSAGLMAGVCSACDGAASRSSSPALVHDLAVQQADGTKRLDATELAVPASTDHGPEVKAQVAGGRVCQRICASASTLGCSAADECPEICEQMRSTVVCVGQLEAFMNCMASQPSEQWICTEEGTAALKEGVCDREQSNYVNCAMKAAP
jgi:hypothetical protein